MKMHRFIFAFCYMLLDAAVKINRRSPPLLALDLSRLRRHHRRRPSPVIYDTDVPNTSSTEENGATTRPRRTTKTACPKTTGRRHNPTLICLVQALAQPGGVTIYLLWSLRTVWYRKRFGQRWFQLLDQMAMASEISYIRATLLARMGLFGAIALDRFGRYGLAAPGFSTDPIRWPVPESGHSDGFFFPSWSQGERWFFTIDINGDQRLDLVQTADPSKAGGQVWTDDIGAYWKVWFGETNGFQ